MPKYRSGTDATTAPSAWSDAEPYYFGNQMPPKDIFKPLPENGAKYQEGQINGFSKNVELPGYRHNGNSLSYIQYGTFPKAGSAQMRGLWGGTWTLGGQTIYHITVDGDNIVIKNFTSDKIVSTLAPSHFGLTKRPRRLGILLVGGGGGSGGFTWYDPDKNGKSSDQYIVSGSGGGGGALVWGVINIDALVDVDSYYHVGVANSGSPGGNADQSGLKHTNPKYGSDGSNGSYTDLWWDWKTDNIKLAVANGGNGGSRGNFQSYATGGEGGKGWYQSSSVFTYLGSKSGGQGCSCHTDPVPSIAAWSASITFAQEAPATYTTVISHESVPAVMQGGLNDAAQAHKVPGGHSYHPGTTSADGNGGTDHLKECDQNVYGRGGAGGHIDQVAERGAPGCFALFY